MSDWPQDPAQTERGQRAEAAIEKMKEGLREYISSMAQEGDIEVIEEAYVFFESRGMGNGGNHWRSGGVVLEHEGSFNTAVGLLTRQPHVLLQAMDPACICDDEH